MTGINAYNKDKIIHAAEKCLVSLKRNNEENIHIEQIVSVETLLKVAQSCTGLAVNISNEEFSLIRDYYV